MSKQIKISSDSEIRISDDGATEPAGVGVAYKRLAIVNVVFVGDADGWVLVDAGLTGTAGVIRRAAHARFGEAPPRAIVMTHGHFDHVGALEELVELWQVPVYAHALEHPYLNGASSYPPPDPSVGGGLMARLSPLYPRKPVDVGSHLRELPSNGEIPEMPGWRWVSSPGHSPGHVSLWRESDALLLAGDAFITTDQESLWSVLLQRPEIHGPPMYFTQNWDEARRSVQKLAALEPEVVISGHGPALKGRDLREGLNRLAEGFDRIARPAEGRYAQEPARADESGTRYVPPKK